MSVGIEYPSHNVFVLNDGVTFSSNFDNGNLANCEASYGQFNYKLWVAPDNYKSEYKINKHSGHFHFVVSGVPGGTTLKMTFQNVSPHQSLYKFDMRPVYKCKATNNKWTRLRHPVQFEKVDDVGNLTIEHIVDISNDQVWFCFTYPYSYEMVQQDMRVIDAHPLNFSDPEAIYCTRELLINSCDGRRVDLVTISAMEGIDPRGNREEIPPQCFPEELPGADISVYGQRGGGDASAAGTHAVGSAAASTIDSSSTAGGAGAPSPPSKISKKKSKNKFDSSILENATSRRAFNFPNKEIVWVSGRVHPGEVPAQHTMKGILDFLMHPTDARAKELRRRYVFKVVPMINPDGVFRGHFRMDQFHQNLNRYYVNPDIAFQPAIFAIKSLLDLYALRMEKLAVYLDLHAHASKRGCFIYGNVMNDMSDQVQNQLFTQLIALNSPHFDYDGCLFSRDHMTRIDPCDAAKGLTAEGSGRVATYIAYGLIHSYTLECNYNCNKHTNEVVAVNNAHLLGNEDPTSAVTYDAIVHEKYTPSIWGCVGRACMIALLDIRKHNPCSRLINTKIKTLERLREVIQSVVKQRKEYRGQGYTSAIPATATPAAGAGSGSGSSKGSTKGVKRTGVKLGYGTDEDVMWKRTTTSVPILSNGAAASSSTSKASAAAPKASRGGVAFTVGSATDFAASANNGSGPRQPFSRPEAEKPKGASFRRTLNNALKLQQPANMSNIVFDSSTVSSNPNIADGTSVLPATIHSAPTSGRVGYRDMIDGGQRERTSGGGTGAGGLASAVAVTAPQDGSGIEGVVDEVSTSARTSTGNGNAKASTILTSRSAKESGSGASQRLFSHRKLSKGKTLGGGKKVLKSGISGKFGPTDPPNNNNGTCGSSEFVDPEIMMAKLKLAAAGGSDGDSNSNSDGSSLPQISGQGISPSPSGTGVGFGSNVAANVTSPVSPIMVSNKRILVEHSPPHPPCPSELPVNATANQLPNI